MKDTHDIKGRLQIQVINRAGEVVEERHVSNQIVETGRNIVAQLFAGVVAAKPVGFFGVGTGSTATLDSTTGLEAEVPIFKTQYRKAIAGPATIEQVLDANGKATGHVEVTITGELGFNEPGTIPVVLTEAGLFNADKAVIKKGGGVIKGGGEVVIVNQESIPSAGSKDAAPPPASGNLYNRVLFEPIKKTADFKLHFFWKITF